MQRRIPLVVATAAVVVALILGSVLGRVIDGGPVVRGGAPRTEGLSDMPLYADLEPPRVPPSPNSGDEDASGAPTEDR